jgi:SAM-dependent methyltransferase
MSSLFTQEFWDERYRSSDRVWSGEPNPRLVERVSDLTPGTALDVGSGEGADAIWLAARGWHVTAIDVSTVALERAAGHAADAGKDVADRITWQQADVLSWEPSREQFDLVSSQFMQLPRLHLVPLNRHLAAAVRPGGSLLIVGHHPSDMHTSVRRPHNPDMFFTAEEIAAALESENWLVVTASAPERQVQDPNGQLVTIHDAVLHAVRRP